jgi:hypothetical protein
VVVEQHQRGHQAAQPQGLLGGPGDHVAGWRQPAERPKSVDNPFLFPP